MPINNASKRKSASGVPFLPLGPGVTPDAVKSIAWRQQSGWGYSGIPAGVAVALAPVASFTAAPRSGQAPLSVQFTDTSSNTPTSWLWTFGDGATSNQKNPSHSYAASGSFTVTLTATNSAGSSTKTELGFVLVSAPTFGGGGGGGGGGPRIRPQERQKKKPKPDLATIAKIDRERDVILALAIILLDEDE